MGALTAIRPSALASDTYVEPERSCAPFTPKHDSKRSGNYAGNDARPKRNEDTIHRDIPPQSDAEQLQQRDQRENDDGDAGKGFQS